ncbi:DUF397 domain-containing protein [Nocardia aobensis]|uniref:DUF397 domain-containing protein n=1 Tax=Nocardia aobensis TaxID=257277 RepID=A0ABW6PE98_9NOCA
MNGDRSTAQWYKSRRSHGKDTCVEVAHLSDGTVGVRDSENPTGPALLFTPPNGAPSPPAFSTASSGDRRSNTGSSSRSLSTAQDNAVIGST